MRQKSRIIRPYPESDHPVFILAGCLVSLPLLIRSYSGEINANTVKLLKSATIQYSFGEFMFEHSFTSTNRVEGERAGFHLGGEVKMTHIQKKLFLPLTSTQTKVCLSLMWEKPELHLFQKEWLWNTCRYGLLLLGLHLKILLKISQTPGDLKISPSQRVGQY